MFGSDTAIVEEVRDERTEKMIEYIRSLKTIEEAMEPYKEQKRDLRKEFRDNSWLNTDEIRAAVKAYRLFKGNFNIDEIVDNFRLLTGESKES